MVQVNKPYLIIPTLDKERARRTLDQAISTAGMEVGSVIAYDYRRSGFTKNANGGLELAMKCRDMTHVCFMNDDARIETDGWLTRLVEALQEYEAYGLASPTGQCRTQPICFGTRGMGRGVQRVRQLPFFCTLVKRSVLDILGPLDSDFIHYGSDSDYCERALRAGFQLIWVQDVYVQNELSPIIQPWKDQDRRRFLEKWNW